MSTHRLACFKNKMNSYQLPFITQTQDDLSHAETKDNLKCDDDDEDLCNTKNDVGKHNHPSSVMVRQHIRKKPKISNKKKHPNTFLMTDTRSHQTIVNIGKADNEEFKKKLMRDSKDNISPQVLASKRAWSHFFSTKPKKRRKKPDFVCVSKTKQTIKSRKKFLSAYNDLTKPMTRQNWELYSPDMD